MIRHDPLDAEGREFDLIIVGGGVYGCCTALEAARRGLRPLLLERDDFGEHTSWNSLRIVHGGLRYLQRLDLRAFHDAVASRRWLLRHFPDQVEPLTCMMPLYQRGLRRTSVMRVALSLNDLLSSRRNKGIDRSDRHIADGRLVSRAETLTAAPGIDRHGLAGAAVWQDAHMPSLERLVIELLRWASAAGATLLNYVEAEELITSGGEVAGVRTHDREAGERRTFAAKTVINCAGPWSGQLAARLDRSPGALFEPSLALNLFLTIPPVAREAVAITPPGYAGTYFLRPWKGGVLAGTYHAPCDRTPLAAADQAQPHVDRFLAQLASALPSLAIDRRSVIRVYAGLLPTAERGTTRLATRPLVHDHGTHGGPRGLFSVSGVKFTTARRVAVVTLRRALARGRLALPPPRVNRPPPAPAPPSLEDRASLLRARPREAGKAVRRIVDEEAVQHLPDLLLRRTDWGLDPSSVAPLLSELCRSLGWSDKRRERELSLWAKVSG